jgi:hypothetical protein
MGWLRRRLGAANPLKEKWPTPATARLLVRLKPAHRKLTPTLLGTLKTAMGMRKTLRGGKGHITWETVLWPRPPFLL